MPGLGDASLMPFVNPASNVKSGTAGTATFILGANGYFADVVFATPFGSTNYAVAFGVVATNYVSFIPTATNFTVNGFRIILNTNNNVDLVTVLWTATAW
jgi:hypothetical protein